MPCCWISVRASLSHPGPLFVLAASVYSAARLGGAELRCVRSHREADLPLYHARRFDGAARSSRLSDAASSCSRIWSRSKAGPVAYVASSAWAVSPAELSLLGWWRVLVSRPVFRSVGSWLWRVLLWGRFVWTVSSWTFVVAGHPDRLGGLRFVLIPLRGFAILAFALGAIGAGTVAEAVVLNGHMAMEFRYFIAAQVIGVLVLFVGPLLPLSMPMLRLQAHGTVNYGRLASNLGRQFERRWIDEGRRDVDPEALAAADFSATTDLFSIVTNAQNINPLILDLRNLAMLVVATLLPFVPIVFAVWPLDELIRLAVNALF